MTRLTLRAEHESGDYEVAVELPDHVKPDALWGSLVSLMEEVVEETERQAHPDPPFKEVEGSA